MNYKVGDWVTDGYEIWKHKENCRAPKEVQETWVKWEPQEGELCVFWNKYKEDYIITRFNHHSEDLYYTIKGDVKDFIAPLEILEELKNKRWNLSPLIL